MGIAEVKHVPAIRFEPGCLNECQAEVDRTFPLESGGVLIGRRLAGNRWHVDFIVGPGPRARHGRIRFSPDLEYQTAAIANRFYATNGESTYLGDWHSHPGASHGRLSLKDEGALRKIIRAPSAQCEEPLMVILWGSPGAWTATAWLAQLGARTFWGRRLQLSSCTIHERATA